jgi:hypothetical protein
MSKPSNCRCGRGGFKAHGHNWRLIHPREAPASQQVKCMACSWKWWTKRRWAARLSFHQERSRSGLTAFDILQRLQDGSLTVCRFGRTVISRTSRGFKQLRIITRESPGGTIYRFVEVSMQGRKRKISVHRLVWMYYNQQLVPTGFDIDHKRHDDPDPDGLHNLRLRESSCNRSRRPLPEDLSGDPF